MNNIKFICFVLFFSIFSFSINLNLVSAADTTPPTVNLTYTNNPTGVGTQTITATYSEPILGTPTISINQPGTADITNANFISPGSTWVAQTAAEANTWNSVTYGNGLYVAVASTGTNRVMTSPDGINWTARAAAQASTWQSVTYGNGLFVAVATTGTNRVMTSPDGITWTVRTAATAKSWHSVTYGNNLFVAVADNGLTTGIMTSPDGITWTTRTAPVGNVWYSVTYGNSLFVVVAADGGPVLTSPDGITWTSRTSPATQWTSVTYGNGLFVAVAYAGGNRVMTSPDGITWTSRTIGSYIWYSVTYGNGLFVAAAVNGVNISTSKDGITWTDQSVPSSQWYSVTYGNGVFVAVSIDGGVMASFSGYTYNYTVNKANGSTYVDGVATVSLSSVTDLAGNASAAPTNNTFVIDTTGPAVALTYTKSPTGVGTQTITATYNKTIVGVPTISIDQPGTTDIVNAAMSGSGTVYTYAYTVSAATGGTYLDGTATVSLSSVADTGGNASSAPTNNTFLIDTTGPTATLSYSKNPAGTGTQIITATYNEATVGTPTISINQPGSTDITGAAMNAPGSVWTSRPATEANNWTSVAYGNGIFVGVSSDGTNKVMTSPDGITWTARSSSINNLQSVTYGNGIFVGVSNSSYVFTSPDGITWTSRNAPAMKIWSSVTYGNGLFVAVSSGTTNGVMTSPDGITWTGQTASSNNTWQSITYGNGLFVVTGQYGNSLMTSPNGITWTNQTGAATNTWQSITYGNGLFVAVSLDGGYRVMTSPDGVTWTSRLAASGAWTSITYGNGLYVAVANSGTYRVMTSPDGITWTGRTAAATNTWQAVTYGNGTFVALSIDGTNRVMTSPAFYTYNYSVGLANGGTYIDGTATVSLSSVADSLGNTSSAVTNNTFVIDTVGPTVALSYTKSPTGAGTQTITATYSKTTASAPTISIDQPGTTDITNVVMSGSGTVYTYAYTVNAATGGTYIDGTATVSLSSVNDLAGNVASAPTNNTFLIDTTGPTVAISYTKNPTGTGAQTITATYSKSISSIPNISINQPGTTDITNTAMSGSGSVYTYTYNVNVANGTTYVDGWATVSLSATADVVGNASSLPTNNRFAIDTSNPTVALTYSSNPTKAGTQIITATYSESISSLPNISINQPGTTDITNATMTPPPIDWVTRTTPSNTWYSVAYGNGVYVAVGANAVMTSPDGATWTTQTPVQANTWKAITYGNGLFVAVASDGTNRVMTSPDGITWTTRVAASASSWNAIAFGNSIFVATSTAAEVMTSPNGIVWTTRTAATTFLRGITYGNGLFVVVSATGSAMTSSDGITWAERSAPADQWNSVAYGNGIYVAVAALGSDHVMTSPDGINWTARTVPEGNYWYTITYGGGLFVAVSNNGTHRVMISSDGINWTTQTATLNSWLGACYGNGTFVALAAGVTTGVMTASFVGGYTYNYTVNIANGTTYVDGIATVGLSTTSDGAGNNSAVPSNNTFSIDTTGPAVALTYSKNPTGTGVQIITATYSKTIVGVPTISINQPGSTDITNAAMSGSGLVYTYSYTVVKANGGTYIDGIATVSLSGVTDVPGNASSAPTNNTFEIDTTVPTAAITYSLNHPVKNGDSLLITATFSKAMADAPVPKIALSGLHTLVAANMTKIDATHYSYNYTIGVGNGTDTVSLSTGTDINGNVVTSTPTSGATFTIDNISPTATIVGVCSTAGNGCTTAGQAANPQQSYSVQNLSGTASDLALDLVQISIKDTTTGKWYSGSSFIDNTETYLLATGTSSWSFNSAAVPLTIDDMYLVNVKATDTALNSSVQSLTFQFTNSPPTVSNVTASEDTNGKVNVTYDVTDIESSQTTNNLFYSIGSTLNGTINASVTSLSVSNATFLPASGNILVDDEIISYTVKTGNTLTGLTRGALNTTPYGHTTGATIFSLANSTTGTGLSNKGTGKIITWTPLSDVSGYESLDEIIKVVANDGSSGSMVGSLASASFVIDAKTPNAVITFDAGIAGVADSATITIPMPVDQSIVEYKISDDAATETNPTTSGWKVITQNTTILWTFDSDIEAKTIKYQYRDSFGNTSTETSVSTQTPVSASSLFVQDASNISILAYDMYIGWEEINPTGFSSYKLEYATSPDDTTYGSYTAIVGGGMNDAVTNYYVHRLLNKDLFYRYRLAVVGTNGNTSVRAGAFKTAKPDGIQNYGEGGGTGTELPDIVKPTITLVGPSDISLSVGDTYEDAGAAASDSYLGVTTDLTSSIVAVGIPASPLVLGNYKVMYTVSDAAGNIQTATRTISVTLASSYNITATAGIHGSISPAGVTSVETSTDQAFTISPDEKYKISSLIVDGVNLAVESTFTFTNVKKAHTIDVSFSPIDTLPPVITVLGSNPMSIDTGTVFVDPGATAVTAVTGESVAVIATGAVDMNIGAEYKITYTATDSYGNVAVATRTVNVVDVTSPVISNISVPVVTSSQVAIVWETNEPADGKVMYGITSGVYENQTTVINTLLKNHLAAISDLKVSTDYYYVIVSADKNGNTTTSPEQTFKTIDAEKVYVSAGGGGIMGVAQSVYDALLAQNENYKSKFGTDVSIPDVSNIKIYDITPFGVSVSFDTSKDTVGFIKYGKDTKYGQVAADDEISKNHIIKISGLTLGTEYNFKIKVMDKLNNFGYSDNQTFTTKFLSENLDELKKIDNVQQFQSEIESTIESILPSLVPPFIDKPLISDITENSVVIKFRTNVKSYPIISYTTDSNYDVTKDNPYDGEMSDTSEKSLAHTLSVVGLKPNTKYHIMAKAFSLPQVVGKSEDIVFTTATSKIKASVVNVKTDSFTVVWSTDELISSIVEYKNIKTGIASRLVDDTKSSSHSVKIENLPSGTSYQVGVSGINKEGNLVEGGNLITVKTSVDVVPPVISNVKVDNTLIVGQTNRVQTIISWQTDKPSTSTIYYEEGPGSSDKELANKQEDPELARNHAVILTVFKPGTIYRFTISSTDSAGNISKLPIRTIITPQKGESIMDIIFKNFDQTFNFINNVK